jgi:hypothetical protein
MVKSKYLCVSMMCPDSLSILRIVLTNSKFEEKRNFEVKEDEQ